MTINPDRIIAARRKIADEPFDVDSWLLLLKHAQCRSIDEARETYEEIISTFPSNGRFWKAYIEHEMRMGNYEKTEKLFQRCLIKVLSIELWKTYLQYVKDTKSSLPSFKEKMAQAYDFALDKMGLDIQSNGLWNDYINFLKGVEAVGSYAENQKIAAIRKVYQRAVITPIINIELMWKEYTTFEQNVNPMIAERLTTERSRDYMNARRVAKEYEAITRGLNKVAPSVPPTGSSEELKQIDLWNNYINWEKSNPLKIEDPGLVGRRTMFAYEQSLLCLGHHPDIWFEAALYLQETAKVLQEKGDVETAKSFIEQASQLYERGISGVLSTCMLLYFSYADFEEQNMKFEKVHTIYQKFLDIPEVDPTLAYVQYIKFCRRAEGIKSARIVFKRAREDTRSNFHVYVCAALMEYYCSKDKSVAFKIFELGLKKFSGSAEFILAYLDYLSHLNEDNNTRVLFERVLTGNTINAEESVDIWNKFLDFESNIGDLASVIKVEKRRAAALVEVGLTGGEDKHTCQVIDRYRFMTLLPLSDAELRSIGYHDSYKHTTGNPLLSHQPKRGGGKMNGALLVDPDNVARPDFSQMVPFKPKVNWRPGEFMVPGGAFPLPPSAAELCTILPPPTSFKGPYVNVDKLCDIFDKIRLPDSPASAGTEPNSIKLFDLAKSVQWIVGADDSRKRKSIGRKGDDSDDDSNISAPTNDLYRKRQQKKIK
ncbi:protein suppressor of forked [Eurytemora carolleeae]|uniref:protein suppressor of forked n=1 Tax=Eurytemora carolleeae TaxID=1294199 RepID=UPI000C77A422|nr:protein suppressor of forked [Eurytemora carolleeae]|eukprot:XP_023339992.1 protein suppressor of forked-like [Eurytemora affinis]